VTTLHDFATNASNNVAAISVAVGTGLLVAVIVLAAAAFGQSVELEKSTHILTYARPIHGST
jgi:hypothetical protein